MQDVTFRVFIGDLDLPPIGLEQWYLSLLKIL